MKTSGKLLEDKVVVTRSKDIGKLHHRSRYGRLKNKNELHLDLIEAVYLSGEKKLRVVDEERNNVSFQNIFKKAAKKVSKAEIKYLVFKDLRNRGILCKKFSGKKFDFYDENDEKNSFISVFSENDEINLEMMKKLERDAKDKNKNLWFAVVDEEGDITYYNVKKVSMTGRIEKTSFSSTKGFLLDNRVVVFDKKKAASLFDKEFYGKGFGEGLQLSLIESLFLIEEGAIEIKNIKNDRKIDLDEFYDIVKKVQPELGLLLKVFRDLKKRGFIVKTGFKFGVHFRGYTDLPDNTHAEYLIHVFDKEKGLTWSEISRAVRLSHTVNKKMVFALVDKEDIDYVNIGRIRP
ncbi:MAG: tRNA-intron lyase [Candidatus Thermoplasmatota archaeon]